ncbi:hypothetical protein LPYR103PRE_05900 [Segatella asaccharophila]
MDVRCGGTEWFLFSVVSFGGTLSVTGGNGEAPADEEDVKGTCVEVLFNLVGRWQLGHISSLAK